MVNYIFVPLDRDTIRNLSAPFRGLGEFIGSFFPGYDAVLTQAGIDLTSDDYFAVSVFSGIFYGLITMFVLAGTLTLARFDLAIIAGVVVGLAISVLIFVRMLLYPTIYVQKKVNSIDSNLIFGLKVVLVQLEAGVSLFDAMVIVSRNELGEMGAVFRGIAKRLNAGEREDEVLKDVASKNSSQFLSKVLWQIVSGMKAGAPIAQVIEESLESLERYQKTQIIAYGSSLRVLTLVYMMVAVIVPAMALTFLSVMNSLPGVQISSFLFLVLLIMVVVAQFMLVGFMKSRRPSLMGGV